MSFSESQNPINELPDQLKSSFNAKIDVMSLFIVKKLSNIVPLIIMVFILAFIFLFFTLFLSHAFIAWYEDYIGKESTAALIVSGFYLLLIIILIVFRKPIFYKPIHKNFTEGFNIKEIHSSSNIGNINSVEDLDNELEKSKFTSKNADNSLNNTVDNIKDFYTFDSIKSRFFTNILDNPRPIIATALQTFMTFQNFQSKRKNRKK